MCVHVYFVVQKFFHNICPLWPFDIIVYAYMRMCVNVIKNSNTHDHTPKIERRRHITDDSMNENVNEKRCCFFGLSVSFSRNSQDEEEQ